MAARAQQEPLESPPMKRRFVAPARLIMLLLGLASMPVLIFVTGVEPAARASVANVVLSFVALLVAFRLIGKRELGRLSPFELVTLMLIPEILSNSLQGQGSVLQSLGGLSAVLFLVLTVSALSQRFEGVQKLVEADPTVLVVDGKLLEHNMNRERIAPDELLSEMRKQGLTGLSAVRFAVLEGSGNITFVPLDPGAHHPQADDADAAP